MNMTHLTGIASVKYSVFGWDSHCRLYCIVVDLFLPLYSQNTMPTSEVGKLVVCDLVWSALVVRNELPEEENAHNAVVVYIYQGRVVAQVVEHTAV